MRLRSTNGVTIEVHDFGGDGEPLLLCHATGFCAGAYLPLASRLGQRFTVHAVDFRGHGDSTAPDDDDFDWAGMGDDVLAAVDAIGAPVHGFGHSMGGAALLIAELRRPGSLRSAYLYEPIVLPAELATAGQPNPMAAGSRRRRATFASRAAAVHRYATRPGLDKLRADALAAYVEHGFRDIEGGVELKCRPEHEALTFEAPKVSLTAITGLEVDAVVALGRREVGGMPAAMAPRVAEALANARLVEYAHLSHFGPLQDPDTVAEDVAQ